MSHKENLCRDLRNIRTRIPLHGQVLLVHKAFLKRKRPLYIRRQEAISKVPDFWLKVVSLTKQPGITTPAQLHSKIQSMCLKAVGNVRLHDAIYTNQSNCTER